MTDIQNTIVLPSAYAKEKGATPQTVMNWIEKAELKPVYSEGRTKLYMRAELDEAAEKYGKGSKAGYIHPDQYKAVEDHRDRLIRVTIERDAQIMQLESQLNDAMARYNSLFEEYNSAMDGEAMDEVERAANKELYDISMTDDEMDQSLEPVAVTDDEIREAAELYGVALAE